MLKIMNVNISFSLLRDVRYFQPHYSSSVFKVEAVIVYDSLQHSPLYNE